MGTDRQAGLDLATIVPRSSNRAWSPEQRRIWQELETAMELREVMMLPGWHKFVRIAEGNIAARAKAHVPSKDKEMYYIEGLAVEEIKTFWQSLMDGLAISQEALANPKEIAAALQAAEPDPADFAGDMGLEDIT